MKENNKLCFLAQGYITIGEERLVALFLKLSNEVAHSFLMSCAMCAEHGEKQVAINER